MGGGSFDPASYGAAADRLQQTGQTFARATTARATGNYRNIAEILDPRKLKNGMREACYAPGTNDLTPIAVSIDCTGSMQDVPGFIQRELPKLIKFLTDKGITDHPNVLFMGHDDEFAIAPDAAFQMSQFEINADKLIEALNEMVIPLHGAGNNGEAYHLSFYALARHTKLECFERAGEKGYFFMICDEEPYYNASNPATNGTTPEIAKEVFGDVNESVVTMLESVRKVCEHYHVFVIRPGHTQNGTNHKITTMWQKLLREAGGNPEHVLEIPNTEDIIPAMVAAIGRLVGQDEGDLVDVLGTAGNAALVATRNVTASGNGLVRAGVATGAIAPAGNGGRKRR